MCEIMSTGIYTQRSSLHKLFNNKKDYKYVLVQKVQIIWSAHDYRLHLLPNGFSFTKILTVFEWSIS